LSAASWNQPGFGSHQGLHPGTSQDMAATTSRRHHDDRLQPRQRGTHTVKEVDMLHAKMDLLMKRMDDLTSEKAAMAVTTQAVDSRMTCEVYGDTGHSGNYCPTTQEDVMYMNGNNNGYRPQGGQTWNQSRPYYQEVIKVIL
jgi:hypothetical protein